MIDQKKIGYVRNFVPLNMETLSANIPFWQEQQQMILTGQGLSKVLGPTGLALVLVEFEKGKMNWHVSR